MDGYTEAPRWQWIRSFAVVAASLAGLWAFGTGCGGPLEVTSITPEQTPRGTSVAVTVRGSGFNASTSLALVDLLGTPRVLSGVELVDATELRATVPGDLAAGRYDVRVRRGADEASLLAGFSVVGDLRIVVVDVGQGDATLVISPVGDALLVDVGPAEAGPHVADILAEEGVTRLAWLVVSHYDADHIGGMRWALAGPDGAVGTSDDTAPEPGALLDRGNDTDQSSNTFADYLALTEGLRSSVVSGDILDLGGGTTAWVSVVNGDIDGLPPSSDPPARFDHENENSVGLVVSAGTFQIFIGGDLTGNPSFSDVVDVETPLGPMVGDVDVYRVNHHGSNTSSVGEFLRDLAPEVSIVTVGQDNGFCHPNIVATNRLTLDGGRLFLTTPGVITPGIFSPAGNECPITSTYLPADAVVVGGDVRLVVDVATGAYVVDGVSFPGDGI